MDSFQHGGNYKRNVWQPSNTYVNSERTQHQWQGPIRYGRGAQSFNVTPRRDCSRERSTHSFNNYVTPLPNAGSWSRTPYFPSCHVDKRGASGGRTTMKSSRADRNNSQNLKRRHCNSFQRPSNSPKKQAVELTLDTVSSTVSEKTTAMINDILNLPGCETSVSSAATESSCLSTSAEQSSRREASSTESSRASSSTHGKKSIETSDRWDVGAKSKTDTIDYRNIIKKNKNPYKWNNSNNVSARPSLPAKRDFLGVDCSKSLGQKALPKSESNKNMLPPGLPANSHSASYSSVHKPSNSPRQYTPVQSRSTYASSSKTPIDSSKIVRCFTSNTKANLNLSMLSRREKIEVKQMLHEHSSRKPTLKRPLPTTSRDSMKETVHLGTSDIVITPVDQSEIALEIGLDLSQVDANFNNANVDCVVIDEDENDLSTPACIFRKSSADKVPRAGDCEMTATNSVRVQQPAVEREVVRSNSSNEGSRSSQHQSTSFQDTCAVSNSSISDISSTLIDRESTELPPNPSVQTPSSAGACTSIVNEQGSLTTVYQISMQEENIRKQLEESRLEIEQLRSQMWMLKNHLDSRLNFRAMLFAEESMLRQRRLSILQESVISVSQSTDVNTAEPADYCNAAIPDVFDTGDCNVSNTDVAFCNGIVPITIEPDASMVVESDDDDCCVSESPASRSKGSASATNAETQRSDVQMLYCGTMAGSSGLAPGVLNQIAQNMLVGLRSPPASVEQVTNISSSCQFAQPGSSKPSRPSGSQFAIVNDDDQNLSDVEPDDSVPSVPEQSMIIESCSAANAASLKPSGSVCSILVQGDSLLYGCSDGKVYRQPLQAANADEDSSSVNTLDRQVYRRHEGRVMCMLLTQVGSAKDSILITVGEDKRMVVVGYPIQATKETFTGIDTYKPNCIIEKNGKIYIGLRNGRVAVFNRHKTLKRRKMDIACNRGTFSHVCALAIAQNGSQRLLCISISDSKEIQLRDICTAKHFGKSLQGLSSPALMLHGLSHYVVSSTGNNEVNIHNLQNDCRMEKTLTFTGPVVSICCKPKEKQIVVADGSGTLSWIGVKDGVRVTMYTNYDITALGWGSDMVFVGCKDGEVLHVQYDSSAPLKCRYSSCNFNSWRTRDLKRHLIDEHISQIRTVAGDSNVVVCRWHACMAVISTDAKGMALFEWVQRPCQHYKAIDRSQFKVHTDERTRVNSVQLSWRSPIQELTTEDPMSTCLNFNEQAIELTLVTTVNLDLEMGLILGNNVLVSVHKLMRRHFIQHATSEGKKTGNS